MDQLGSADRSRRFTGCNKGEKKRMTTRDVEPEIWFTTASKISGFDWDRCVWGMTG